MTTAPNNLIDPGSLPLALTTKIERLGELAGERDERAREGLRCYRPMETQMAFHLSKASERVVRGGNRSGKSVSVAAEFASAAMGVPIIGPDNKPLPFRYPTGRQLIMWAIGYDSKHIGQTIYRLLCEQGLFRIIKDVETGTWRSYRPWEEEDRERESEIAWSGPLLPERCVKGVSWERKGSRIFEVIELKNGNRIFGFGSKGEPKAGDPVDVLWIDEDIKYPGHVAEFQARLSDRKGKLLWSALPHSENDALIRMSIRATEEEGKAEPDVHETRLIYSANPFIDSDEKRKRLAGWTEDERRVRDRGEFLTDTVLMYPEFNVDVHGTPKEDRKQWDLVDELLASDDPSATDDWTRYLWLDPGHTFTAALVFAIPPEDCGKFVVVENEIYLRNASADRTAQEVAAKAGNRVFEAFGIDARSGRRTPEGGTQPIQQQYSDKFDAYGLVSQMTGPHFLPGSTNIPARVMLVHEWLRVRADGTPMFRIAHERCPNTVREFRAYRKKVTASETTDIPIAKNNHAMNVIEYAAASRCEYVLTTRKRMRHSPAYEAFKTWQKADRKHKPDYIHLGPGPL